MLDLAGPGANVVGLIRAAELSSLPKEARRIAKESRRASRQAVGHPVNSGGRASALGDEDSMKSEVEEITKMNDSPDKRDRVFKFLEDFPDGAEALRGALGI